MATGFNAGLSLSPDLIRACLYIDTVKLGHKPQSYTVELNNYSFTGKFYKFCKFPTRHK